MIGTFIQDLRHGARLLVRSPGFALIATYATVLPALLAVMLLASYLPARRAARTDPLRALRVE